MDGEAQVGTRRKDHGPSALVCRGVDGPVDSRRVEGLAVAPRPELADIENGAGEFDGSRRCGDEDEESEGSEDSGKRRAHGSTPEGTEGPRHGVGTGVTTAVRGVEGVL